MSVIETNKSLKALNTFGFEQKAERFIAVHTDDEMEEMVRHARHKSWPVFILGGGSNIVLTKDIPGLVIHLAQKHIDYDKSGTKHSTLVNAGAGVNWHQLVMQTLSRGLQGLENLSLIPGSVGAAPIQNIGAYGIEVKDRIKNVRALHLPTVEWRNFTVDDCNFAYRYSYFKAHTGQYAIAEVTFALGENYPIDTGYQSLTAHLHSRGLDSPSAIQVSESVIAIRQSRLPDPAHIGNAGSFFHNPVVSLEKVERLKEQFPQIVAFDAGEGNFKLSAAWLIDHLGFRGIRQGGVGVYENQALVLINEGTGTGTLLLNLANKIQLAVKNHFGVELSIEPIVI